MGIGIYFKYAGIATSTVMDIIGKFADGVFTLPEMVDTIEKTARQAVPGVDDSDFDRLQAVTSVAEFENAFFEDGDIALIIPRELNEKLKIDLSRLA